MNIALIGSGGREHALCQKMHESSIVNKIVCLPGNAGTAKIAQNIEINILNFKNILNLVKLYKIDFVVVGPEEPLVKGLVNFLEKNKIKVFGPNKYASKLEGSKSFMKRICARNQIPTAKFKICITKKQVINCLKSFTLPIVVKADGLAAGKGVYICENNTQSIEAVNEIFGGKFGKAENILIEEFLEGEEMSFFILSDGRTYQKFDTAQDHKRVLEGDKGKNTGGMGAYSPSRLINEDLKNKIINKIIKPTLEGLAGFGSKYKGFLYTGLMIVKNEPYLIEYNVRMGDPECQTILPKLKTDINEIFLACCEEELNNVNIEWTDKKSLCIVVCSKGYPEEFKKNIEIKNLSKIKLDQDEYLFHAGTIDKESRVFAVGGRVLNFISLSENLTSARDKVINKIDKLNWDEGFYRKDIGYKVIDE